jgi:hypothetical protein
MPTIKSDETVVLNLDRTIMHGDRKVGYIASVKNSPEGKAWIRQLRKLNPDFRVQQWTTGTNRKERFAKAGKTLRTWYNMTSKNQNDAGYKLPSSVADRFRVYVRTKPNKGEYSRNLSLSEVILP